MVTAQILGLRVLAEGWRWRSTRGCWRASAAAIPDLACGLILEGRAGRVRRFVNVLRRGERSPKDVVEPGAERRCLFGRWMERMNASGQESEPREVTPAEPGGDVGVLAATIIFYRGW
ncbi:MAG: hypothetical protein B7Z66_12075 [Chromatiales bacterium 21-64-14]|nr:MAG: hypothetical protein B7Z66_12075 [Chromatiales bacterium 21-64-14]